jgi:hypothetical protein
MIGGRNGHWSAGAAVIQEYIYAPRIAYFSMEIPLRNEIPTYAGGLGTPPADPIRSVADLIASITEWLRGSPHSRSASVAKHFNTAAWPY